MSVSVTESNVRFELTVKRCDAAKQSSAPTKNHRSRQRDMLAPIRKPFSWMSLQHVLRVDTLGLTNRIVRTTVKISVSDHVFDRSILVIYSSLRRCVARVLGLRFSGVPKRTLDRVIWIG